MWLKTMEIAMCRNIEIFFNERVYRIRNVSRETLKNVSRCFT